MLPFTMINTSRTCGTVAQTEHLHEFTMDAREDESWEHGSCSSCSLVFDRAAPLIPNSGIPPIAAAVSKHLRVSPTGQAAVKIPHDFLQGLTVAAILSDMQGNDFCRPPIEIVVGLTYDAKLAHEVWMKK
jgi:hypothetical protein